MTDASRREALKLSAAAGVAALGTALLQGQPTLAQETTAMAGGASFEAVNQLMERASAGGGVERAVASAKAAAADVPDSWQELICPNYRAVRPILAAIATLPFIPANWRVVINAFIAIMDQICPPNE